MQEFLGQDGKDSGGIPFSLDQTTVGSGFPVASHSREASSPSVMVTRPEVGTAFIAGATKTIDVCVFSLTIKTYNKLPSCGELKLIHQLLKSEMKVVNSIKENEANIPDKHIHQHLSPELSLSPDYSHSCASPL